MGFISGTARAIHDAWRFGHIIIISLRALLDFDGGVMKYARAAR